MPVLMNVKKQMPAKAAAKRTFTDRTLLGAIGCFSVVTIVFAYRVSGDEAMKILIGASAAFAMAFLRYMFGPKAK